MAPAKSVTIATLIESYAKRLELEWIAGHEGAHTAIVPPGADVTRISLIGHLNFIHPHRIQALGNSEFEYLDGLAKGALDDTLASLFSGASVAVIITDGHKPPDYLVAQAALRQIPLFVSQLATDKLIDHVSYYLSAMLADKIIVHGVFMDVMGIGVLLTGESAVGKSELALELISRGHRLIADDAPEFSRTSPDTLFGTCPEILHDFLEVRGLGVINIRAMFGDSAIKRGKNLRLVVNLTPGKIEEMAGLDRLHGSRHTRQILEVDIAEINLPVAPGRNLAVLVEAAARSQILHHNGYDPTDDFIERQRKFMDRGTP
jgi:HPr kinase/phosphorylase